MNEFPNKEVRTKGPFIYLDIDEFPHLEDMPEGQEVKVEAWGTTRGENGGMLKVELRQVDVQGSNMADKALKELEGEAKDDASREEVDDEDDDI